MDGVEFPFWRGRPPMMPMDYLRHLIEGPTPEPAPGPDPMGVPPTLPHPAALPPMRGPAPDLTRPTARIIPIRRDTVPRYRSGPVG